MNPSQPTSAVYLDHAATTPMLPEAVAAMTAQFARTGNANSLHASGREARRVVEESREAIAGALRCRPGEVVFTSGGTEADNLALKGIAWHRRGEDPRRERVVTTSVEHHAVLDPVEWLGAEGGAKAEFVAVDAEGRVRVEELTALVEADPASVALISVMWANNEVGTLQPIGDVVALARRHGIPVHADAVQAVGAVPVDVAASGVDALTVSAHKLGGPLGVGALVVRREVAMTPLLHGGGQERKVRSGTVNTPAIAGFAAALTTAVERQEVVAQRLSALRDDLVAGVLASVPDARLNGDPRDRLPGNVHLSFPGCEGDALLMLLDHQGIHVSTGSACSAGVPQPSHVLLAMGRDEDEARSSLRLTLGHTSTRADVEAVLSVLPAAVERARGVNW